MEKHSYKTRIYNVWRGMKKRCYYAKHRYYHCYGGRGITVCDEWKESFTAFYNWAMSHGYRDDLTIDRIDVNGNYEPGNCAFIPQSEQGKNTRVNVRVTINGVTKILSDWAKYAGITSAAIGIRFKNGLTGEELIAPSQQGQGHRVTDITINGVSMSAAKWAKKIGITESTFLWRVQKWGIGEHLLVGRQLPFSFQNANKEAS